MKALLRPNFDKDGSVAGARLTVEALLETGITPLLDRADAAVISPVNEGCLIGEFGEMLSDCDIVITIGGDGTILHAVQAILGRKKPLLGINTGRIGFLTQLEISELGHFSRLKEGNYEILNRMLLKGTLDREDDCFFALNDIVIFRGGDHLIEIEVHCDTGPVASHRADGVIFSTPTGSTAYSLSAGGSIVHPSLELIQMTAVCPHSHFNHSAILSPERTYRAKEAAGSLRGGAVIMVDGMRAGVLERDKSLTIAKAPQSIQFIDLGIRDFYNCVDIKLSYRR
ncbi:MAG: NAD(+)/NADH kinase [Oscillospiraceae bacterium]|jgi:NAD+ kinase|nr:NAD(+)/NADH kinase [Oscillospiraceae bacterium]